jgi:hypothetical protein
MKRLDRMIIRSYEAWVEAAPDDYKSDLFLQSRIPVAVTSRFGQNQEFASSVDLWAEELDNWARDRDYGRIKYMTIALATHIRYEVITTSIINSNI